MVDEIKMPTTASTIMKRGVSSVEEERREGEKRGEDERGQSARGRAESP